jgi:hypothetical protein
MARFVSFITHNQTGFPNFVLNGVVRVMLLPDKIETGPSWAPGGTRQLTPAGPSAGDDAKVTVCSALHRPCGMALRY